MSVNKSKSPFSRLAIWAVIALCYLAAFLAVAKIITPIQGHFLPEITEFASLCFLPHGVRVISTWYYRMQAVPALFLGQILPSLLLQGHLPPAALLAPMFVSAISAYGAFVLLSWFGGDAFYVPARQARKTYPVLLQAGLLASLINAVGLVFVLPDQAYADLISPTIVIFVLGDNIGLFTLLLILMVVFRVQPRLR